MSRALAVLPALVAGSVAAQASDVLILQRTVAADEKAPAQLLLDRERVVAALLRQAAKDRYLVELTLAAQPNLVLQVTCRDLAGAQQVMDALRPRGGQLLDVSGRCWF